MRMKLLTLTALFTVFNLMVFAQERERKLSYNQQQAEWFAKERTFAPRAERGGGMLSLPFFDDFSRYSLPTNNPNIPLSYQRWSDQGAFINNTFPISPLTLGVATLDGLQSDGTPYHDTLWFETISESYLEWGQADSLTSLPIDLDGYTAEDSVFLYFHYESGGWGNAPDEDGILGAQGDSLILEFYTPLQAGEWMRVWEVQGGAATDTFQGVWIHIADPLFLQSGFRFRFKNFCTQHGALDHWHLDYVMIESDLHPDTYEFDEVSAEYPQNTLLNFGYTSMPWTHFQDNPGLYMADQLTYYNRNLGPNDENIATRWKVSYEGSQVFESDVDVDGQNNANSERVRTMSTQGFEYNTPTTVDSASFTVCVNFNQTDAHIFNDTTCFEQKFSNYYAYDDGTAERAYGLENAGGKVAMKFSSAIGDTLLGYYMYFIPVQYLATDQSFIIQVWDDNTGQPGSLLTDDLDNFNYSIPHYFESGPNLFVYYPLMQPIFIDAGDFYVGYVQQSDVSLNMGLDKNTAANTTKLFFQLQGNSTWNQSSIAGSVMVRPVFKSGLPQWVGVEEQILNVGEIFPNPAQQLIQFTLPSDHNQYRCSLFDMTGRLIREEMTTGNGIASMDVSTLDAAQYMLRVTDIKTGGSVVRRFMAE